MGIFKGMAATMLAGTVLAGAAIAEGRPNPDVVSDRASARLAAGSSAGEVSSAATSVATVTPQVNVTTTARTRSSSTKTRPPEELRRMAVKHFDTAFYEASAQRNAQEIAELTQAFINLGPNVDPAEAARAARVVYTYVDQLVVEYEITDGPLAHNTKVNLGRKPRGLCWHWAHDIDARLMRERFRTLQIHRAIANHDNIRLEHSTTMLGARGAPMSEALVLDPWRKGGVLFWEQAKKDTRYNWTEREEVFAYKRAIRESKGSATNASTGSANRF